MAIRRVLAPLTEVRVLVPQPKTKGEQKKAPLAGVPSSSGLGYRPLTPATRVRVPLGLPETKSMGYVKNGRSLGEAWGRP